MLGDEDVRAAAQRIAGRVVRTPVIRSEAIGRLVGAEVWLKLDSLQTTGAFKERGRRWPPAGQRAERMIFAHGRWFDGDASAGCDARRADAHGKATWLPRHDRPDTARRARPAA